MQETQETQVQSLGREDPLEEEMATHSSILPWKNPIDKGAWAGYSPKSHKELAQLDNKDIHERLIESVFLKLEYNCFTVLCYFLSYNREN